jgi:hypothetical protein
MNLTVRVPDELLDALAERVAERLQQMSSSLASVELLTAAALAEARSGDDLDVGGR